MKKFSIVLLGNFITLIGIFILFFFSRLMEYPNSNYANHVIGALRSMAWISPFILVILVMLFIYDFIHCQEKSQKWLLKETVIIIFIIFGIFMLSGLEKGVSIWTILIATITTIILFGIVQITKYIIVKRFCGITS